MKYQIKPELFAPCYPMFAIKSQSVSIDADMVQFTLEYGVVEIECEAQATEYSDSIYLEPQDKPECGEDKPYTRLEVDADTPITPTRYDVDLVDGQKIKLTDAQVACLNEWLVDICQSKFEFEMAA